MHTANGSSIARSIVHKLAQFPKHELPQHAYTACDDGETTGL